MTRRPKPKASRGNRKPAKAPKPAKAAKTEVLDDFILSGARALDIKVKAAWMPAVRAHLAVTLRFGAVVAAFDLPDDTEPAPVFRA